MAIPKLFAVRFDYTGNGELVEGAAAVIADSSVSFRQACVTTANSPC
jgi:hypothetical protein